MGEVRQISIRTTRDTPFKVRLMVVTVMLNASIYIHAQPAQDRVEWMTVNGYSGIGVVPSARTISAGHALLNYSNALPVATDPKGYNYQVGFGLTESLETNFRLATQNLRCNYFNNECPPGTIRDLSGSVKWSPSYPWLVQNGLNVAIGASDIGGAATNFRSIYGVMGGSWGSWDWTAGWANGKAPYTPLDKAFAGIDYRPNRWSLISLQRIHDKTSLHAGAAWQLPGTQVELQATFSHSIGSAEGYPRQWGSIGIGLPLGENIKARSKDITLPLFKRGSRSIRQSQIVEALRYQGFNEVHVKESTQDLLSIAVENTVFATNTIDALGVALGVIAGLTEDKDKIRLVQLVITQRRLPLYQAISTPECIAKWLQNGNKGCDQMELLSSAHEGSANKVENYAGPWWSEKSRPELIASPIVTSTIGTEVGAFDADVGYLLNVIMPLWRGATLDFAYLGTTDLRSKQFQDDGYYAQERLKDGVARKMAHQVIDFPNVGSQIRLSAGLGYGEWKGAQLETMTTSPGGAHRFGLASGSFTGPVTRDPIFGLPIEGLPKPERRYQIAQYRWAHGPDRTWHTEMSAGTFWGQDRGVSLTQRFWFSDSNVSVYYRRSKMPEAVSPVSFAGIQITIPLTPRRILTTAIGSVRGTNNWSYAVESKVGETDNIITRGYGEIPRFGESLTQLYNRDRYDGEYLRAHAWRIQEAFHRMTRD